MRTILPPHFEARQTDRMKEQVATANGLPGVVATLTDRSGTIFSGSAGTESIGSAEAMTTDTVLAIFSATKPVVAVALLQQAERGALDLDAPAERYLPQLAGVRVLDGIAADGSPILRPPARDITTRMLMLHTAGFGYDYFNHDYGRLLNEGHIVNPGESTWRSLQSPLLFDPGEGWEYGLGMDWAGMVLQAVTGTRLRDVLRTEVLEPLGMSSTSFVLTPQMQSRLAAVHARLDDGTLTPTDYVLPQETEIDMAGHGLYSTADDYTAFLRMWLNDGLAEGGRILKADTVEMASRSGVAPGNVKPLPGVNRFMTLDLDFFGDLPCSWGLSMMINDEVAPTGRPAGSLGWAGMANSYFWIDRATGIAGFWSTQILPFFDEPSIGAFREFETDVYNTVQGNHDSTQDHG